MKILKNTFLRALAISALMMPGFAKAIPTTSDVKLDACSGNEVILTSSAIEAKAKDAQVMAVKQAFHALLNDGVDGLHNGQPMLSSPNKEFNYTFYKDKMYEKFLTSTAVKLDESKIGSNRKVTMKVSINIKRLLEKLTDNKLVISPAWQDSKDQTPTSTLNPTIVVVPYLRGEDQSFQGMKDCIDTNPAMKHAVNSVCSMFASRGFKTRDFTTMLQNSKTDDILQEGTQTDAVTMVIQQLPADIVVSVDLDLIKDGNKGQCTLNLNAVERQTAGKLASVSYGSGQYMTTDFVTLSNHALKKVENNFFDQIQNAFAVMVEKGREMNLEFLLGESVNDWDFDTPTPATESDFKEELEEWLRSTSHKGVYDMSQSNDKYIAASINIPLWDSKRERSYSITNFNSALKKFMKHHFGDAYNPKMTAMGQKLIITIE